MKKLLLTFVFLCSAVDAKDLSLDVPCDLSVENLGSQFTGHNVVSIISALNKIDAKKDEYESSADYEWRIADAMSQMPSAIAENALCFADERDLGGMHSSYDAETGTLYPELFLHNSEYILYSGALHEVYWQFGRELKRKESTYRGTNAFGVTAEVDKVERSVVMIGFPTSDFKLYNNPHGIAIRNGHIVYPMKLPAEQARSMHGNIRVALFYGVKPPMVVNSERKESATWDSPVEFNDDRQFIIARLRGFAVFDFKTGEVIKTVSLETTP